MVLVRLPDHAANQNESHNAEGCQDAVEGPELTHLFCLVKNIIIANI